MPITQPIYVNGIDGTTGEYLVPPLKIADLIDRIIGPQPESWWQRLAATMRRGVRGLELDRDPKQIASAGWGIVFHEREAPAVREALAPLVAHRRTQVGDDSIVKELVYKDGDERSAWLARHGIAPPNVDPQKVPYYLLVVGPPSSIPFRFTHHLSADYAIGRIDFERPEQYAAYAEGVVAYETAGQVPNEKRVAVFGPRHDPATNLSADELLTGLTTGSAGLPKSPEYAITSCIAEKATKAALAELTSRPAPPALLFTASHGMGWPKNYTKQEQLQGALLCQDWSGKGMVTAGQFFSADDVNADANVSGLVVFNFACFSAGTPDVDRFPVGRDRRPQQIASRPFTAALPKRLLSHERGPALACVGHVERAWGCSIESPEAGAQLRAFENFIYGTLHGLPVGYAMSDFRQKYAVLSIEVSDLIERRESYQIDEEDLARKWVERNDAEAYLLLGDPAVRLRPDAMRPNQTPEGGSDA